MTSRLLVRRSEKPPATSITPSRHLQYLSILNVRLFPAEDDLCLAGVGKFFLVSLHDSRIVWICPEKVLASSKIIVTSQCIGELWHTIYRTLKTFLIPHQHLDHAIVQCVSGIWKDADVLLRFVSRPGGRVELWIVRNVPTETVCL